MFYLLLCQILLFNLSQCLCYVITTPSGMRIPVAKVLSALPNEKRNNPHLHVYDIDNTGDLIGPNSFKLQLSSQPDREEEVSSHPAFYSTLNGQLINPVYLNSTRKFHGEYTAVYGGAHGKVIALWGPGCHLLPVDYSQYPNVFVNTIRDENKEVEGINPEIESNVEDTVDGSDDTRNNSATATDTIPDCQEGSIHYIEILGVVDNTLCAKFGNDLRAITAVLQASLDIANEPFRLQTCVRLVLVGVEAHCNDPNDPYSSYRSLNGGQIVGAMRNLFLANRVGVNRDTAILFSGFYDTSGAIGTAYRPGTCEGLGYGWVEGINPFTLAHEIGHNLNMYHTGTSIGSGLMGTRGKSRSEFYFTEGSVKNLTLYIDHGVAKSNVACISNQAPVCESTCTGACVNNKCVVNNSPEVGTISCVPSAGNFECSKRTNINGLTNSFYNTLADCPTGYNFVSKPYDANDPTLVCCLPSEDTTTAQGVNTQYSYIRERIRRNDGNVYRNIISLAQNYSLETLTFINTKMVPCNGDLSNTTPSASSPSPSISTPLVSPSISVSVSPSSTSAILLTALPSDTPSISSGPSYSMSAIPSLSMTVSSSPVATMTSSQSQSFSDLFVSPSVTPSSSVSPHLTSIPLATTTTTKSSTPISTYLSTSPSMTAPPSPSTNIFQNEPKTCGDTFTENMQLSCSTAVRRTIRISRIGSAKFSIRIRSGFLRFIIKGIVGSKIRAFGMIASTSKRLKISGVKGKIRFFRRRMTVIGDYETEISDLPLTSPRNNCCGKRAVYAYVGIRLCNGNRNGCRTAYSRIALELKCQSICPTQNALLFTPIPMSAERVCPTCKRI